MELSLTLTDIPCWYKFPFSIAVISKFYCSTMSDLLTVILYSFKDDTKVSCFDNPLLSPPFRSIHCYFVIQHLYFVLVSIIFMRLFDLQSSCHN